MGHENECTQMKRVAIALMMTLKKLLITFINNLIKSDVRKNAKVCGLNKLFSPHVVEKTPTQI